MKGIILLNYGENTKQIEEEEKLRFLKAILEQMNVPLEGTWDSESLSVDEKIKLRKLLYNLGIQVIDDLDGFMEIYVENEKVAEWHKPMYKLKRDLQQLDRRKQFFLEMEVSFWSLFEENEISAEND